MAETVGVEFDQRKLAAIEQMGKNAPVITFNQLRFGMHDINEQIRGELIRILPTDQGMLRNSVTTQVTGQNINDLNGITFPASPADRYAVFVEKGRGPGPISREGQEAIIRWAERKGFDRPEAVVWAIRKRGTVRHRQQGPDVGEWAQVRSQKAPKIVNRVLDETAAAIANKIAESIETGSV